MHFVTEYCAAMSDITALNVEFLFHLHATLDAPVVVPNGPHGTRVIVGLNGGTVTGPKINGTVAHLGADWLTLRADGTAQWAYKGKPLYTWIKDGKPGDRTGDGVNNAWRIARP